MRKRDIILELKDVSLEFKLGKNIIKAVDNVSFKVFKGETFGLVGESGSGKTSIARAIIRLNKIKDGEILFKGKRISGKISKELRGEIRREIQMIFQDPISSLNERAKVDYIIGEGLYNLKSGLSGDGIKKAILKSLMEVGLEPEHASRFPHEFSGGQRQRIGIARALIMEPDFIIADEPISALDASVRAQIMNLLIKLQREKGLTYLFISHDLSIIRYICHRIAILYRGKLVELGETEKIFNNPIHPYTKSLIAAIPIPDPIIEKNRKIIDYYNDSEYLIDKGRARWVEIEADHFVLKNYD